jgi:hypothetical protein
MFRYRYGMVLLIAMLLLVSAGSASWKHSSDFENGNYASATAAGTGQIYADQYTSAGSDGAIAQQNVDIDGSGFAATTASSEEASATTFAAVEEGDLDAGQIAAAGEVEYNGVEVEGALAAQEVDIDGTGIAATTASSEEAEATAFAAVEEGDLDAGQIAAAGEIEGHGVDVEGALAAQEVDIDGTGIAATTASSEEAEAAAFAAVEEGDLDAGQIAAAGELKMYGDEAEGALAAQEVKIEGESAIAGTEAKLEDGCVEAEAETLVKAEAGRRDDAEIDVTMDASVIQSEDKDTLYHIINVESEQTSASANLEGSVEGKDVFAKTEASIEDGSDSSEAKALVKADKGDITINGMSADASETSVEVSLGHYKVAGVGEIGSSAQADISGEGDDLSAKTTSETHGSYVAAGSEAEVEDGSLDTAMDASSKSGEKIKILGFTIWDQPSEAESSQLTAITGEDGSAHTWADLNKMDADVQAEYDGHHGSLETFMEATAGGKSPLEINDIWYQTANDVDAFQATKIENAHFAKISGSADNGEGYNVETLAILKSGDELNSMQGVGASTTTGHHEYGTQSNPYYANVVGFQETNMIGDSAFGLAETKAWKHGTVSVGAVTGEGGDVDFSADQGVAIRTNSNGFVGNTPIGFDFTHAWSWHS